jgi:hypothetical protein
MEKPTMSRIKLSVLSALVVLIMGAVGASSAGAAFTLTTEACSGAVIVACYSTTEGGTLFEFSGEEAFKGEADLNATTKEPEPEILLAAVLGGLEIHITCTNATAEGTFSQAAKLAKGLEGKGKITFTGCALLPTLSTKCKVPATLATNEITSTYPSTTSIVFKPSAGTIFIEIPFENNGVETCPATIKGKQPVTGQATCSDAAGATDKLEHLVLCEVTEASKELKLGGSGAHFLLDISFKLVNSTTDFWSVSEG